MASELAVYHPPPELLKFEYNYNLEGPTTDRNCVNVWTYSNTPEDSNNPKTWLIYIHGGGWRDPEVTPAAFEPAMNELWSSLGDTRIAGFASIDYRLSPHPHHERLPSDSEDESRNVVHPAHVQDVEKALVYLQKAYAIADRYLLIGHSAGATLAFQVKANGLPRPVAVLGVAGIYDLRSLVNNHEEMPIYRQFVSGAFPDEKDWDVASPARTSESGRLWETAKLVVISHSKSDWLVEEVQATLMLERVRSSVGQSAAVHFVEAEGSHDGIWENGSLLANVITKSLDLLDTVR